jgi:hypothetical protein
MNFRKKGDLMELATAIENGDKVAARAALDRVFASNVEKTECIAQARALARRRTA